MRRVTERDRLIRVAYRRLVTAVMRPTARCPQCARRGAVHRPGAPCAA